MHTYSIKGGNGSGGRAARVVTLRRPEATEDFPPQALQDCLLTLLEAVPGVVMAWEAKGRLLHMSKAGRAMLGLDPRKDLSGRQLHDFYSPDAWERLVFEAIPTCLKAGYWRGDTSLLHRDGKPMPVCQVLVAHRIRESVIFSAVAWDMSESKRTEALLWHRATHDPLTGLPNRWLLKDRLRQEMRTADRSGKLLGVLFLDLDDFKPINDQYGHETGNGVLRALGPRLERCLRAGDTIARYGGDEFVILTPRLAGPADVTRVRAKIAHALLEPFTVGRWRVQVSASIGCAMYPCDGEDIDTLLHAADSAMYECKRGSTDPAAARPVSAARPAAGHR